jgi:tight adherence protein B
MELIISILIFLFIISIIIGALFMYRSKAKSGAKEVHQRLERVTRVTFAERRAQGINLMRTDRKLSNVRWFDHLLRNVPFARKIDNILQQSDSRLLFSTFLSITFFLGFFGFICPFYLTSKLLLSLPVAVVLSIIPLFYISIKKKQRIKKFEKQLPEALDMLARALKAGHALPGGLQMVAEEFDDPMGAEFTKIVEGINYGLDIKDALTSLAERVDVPDLKYLVVAVKIQRESGGDLAVILGSISQLIRARFKLQDRVLTLSAEGRISAKILIAVPICLAAYFFMLQPGYVELLITDPIGHKLLIFSSVTITLGVLVMRKIVAIKV